MPRPLSTHEVGGVSGRSLTEMDLCSWPTLSRPGANPPTERKNNNNKIKIHYIGLLSFTVKGGGVVGRADRTILVPRA